MPLNTIHQFAIASAHEHFRPNTDNSVSRRSAFRYSSAASSPSSPQSFSHSISLSFFPPFSSLLSSPSASSFPFTVFFPVFSRSTGHPLPLLQPPKLNPASTSPQAPSISYPPSGRDESCAHISWSPAVSCIDRPSAPSHALSNTRCHGTYHPRNSCIYCAGKSD
ncbi:hypothetical protein M011DRAFT_471342, partial [Sporormia fimetaria CBS 119925]